MCVVSEITDQVIGERRMSNLIELGSELTKTNIEAHVVAACEERRGAERRSFPFTLMYLFDDDGTGARLTCSPGIPAGHPAAPALIELADPNPCWPVGALAKGETVAIDELAERFPSIPSGAWDRPPAQAPLGIEGKRSVSSSMATVSPLANAPTGQHGFGSASSISAGAAGWPAGIPGEHVSRALVPSSSNRYMRVNGKLRRSAPRRSSTAATTWASILVLVSSEPNSIKLDIRRSPMTWSVISLTTHNMPTMRSSSSVRGLYEKVWYVSST